MPHAQVTNKTGRVTLLEKNVNDIKVPMAVSTKKTLDRYSEAINKLKNIL